MANNHATLPGTALEVADAASNEILVAKWYAVHTFSHHEQRVNKRLSDKRLNTYLPLYTARSLRKDVKTLIEKPLFPGYLFVFVPLVERLTVLQVPGVVRLVGFGGKPTPLTEQEIESLRTARAMGVYLEPFAYPEIGQKVRIKAGPFEGFQGILIRRKGKYRVVLSLESITSSPFVLDVDSCNVVPVKTDFRSEAALGSGAQYPADQNPLRVALGTGGAYVSPS